MTPKRFQALQALAGEVIGAPCGEVTGNLARGLSEALAALQAEEIEKQRLRAALRTLLGEA